MLITNDMSGKQAREAVQAAIMSRRAFRGWIRCPACRTGELHFETDRPVQVVLSAECSTCGVFVGGPRRPKKAKV